MASSQPPILHDQTKFLSGKRLIGVFLGLEIALTCALLDTTIVATALPQIASELKAGRESSWVATAYLLTNIAFISLYGRWSDIFGRKPMLIVSLVLFWIFSLACSLSKTMIQLIVFRALQGVGGAAIFTLSYIIISDVISLKDRGKYSALNEISGIIAQTGQVLGGVFTQYATWRWCFWINLPLCGLAILAAIFLLPLRRVPGDIKEKLLKVDYAGSALIVCSLVPILIGLTWGGSTYPWVSVPVLTPLCLGAALTLVLLGWEGKVATLPIIPLHIFKNRTVSGVFVATFANGMTHFATLFYIPQFLQITRGYTPLEASAFLLPFLVGNPIALFFVGHLVSKTGKYRPQIVFGYTCWLGGQIILATMKEGTNNATIIGSGILAAVGSGSVYQTTLVAAQAAVPRQEMAVVTGVRNLMRNLGSVVALAVASTLVNNQLRSSLDGLALSPSIVNDVLNDPTLISSRKTSRLPLSQSEKSAVIHEYTKAIQWSFWMTVAACAIALCIAIFVIQTHSLERPDDETIKQRANEEKSAREAPNVEEPPVVEEPRLVNESQNTNESHLREPTQLVEEKK
ncbi:MFS general substrate transporter [Flagelloscypha sp. PMI_526]|nr:MFS general substrate transporter [Flagelloscypha sp. PMI_526]